VLTGNLPQPAWRRKTVATNLRDAALRQEYFSFSFTPGFSQVTHTSALRFENRFNGFSEPSTRKGYSGDGSATLPCGKSVTYRDSFPRIPVSDRSKVKDPEKTRKAFGKSETYRTAEWQSHRKRFAFN
jgi:hypothetical protein